MNADHLLIRMPSRNINVIVSKWNEPTFGESEQKATSRIGRVFHVNEQDYNSDMI